MSWTIKGGYTAAGRDASWNTVVDDGNGESIVNPTLEAAQTPTGWTKGSASAGTAVLVGHTIESADVVDVYWAAGIRYGMVATVSGSSIALADGDGDDLPASDTAIQLCVRVVFTVAFDGDDLTALIGSATYRGLVTLLDVGGTAANAKTFEILPTAGLGWSGDSGLVNPLAGFTVASGTISSTDPTSATTEKPVTFGWKFDATPNYPG